MISVLRANRLAIRSQRHRAGLALASVVATYLLLHGDEPLSNACRFAASSSWEGSMPSGASDGDRFRVEPAHVWAGRAGERGWWWQVEFPRTVQLGTILQVQGDHEFVARHLPETYAWEASRDGVRWRELDGTRIAGEQRLFRIHRLKARERIRFLRLRIDAATDGFPVLREIEVYASPRASVPFPDWIVAVNTTHDRTLPGHGQEFIPLARSTTGGGRLQAQQVWVGDFDDSLLRADPRPLCAFLSGNFKDWCEVERNDWRGVQQVLAHGRLPLWASCGGAQGLAIVAESGVDRPWDCPHCRDPENPKLPIYTHIGHTGSKPCGDYSACVFERGPVNIRIEVDDPAFTGLSREIAVMESHCGQIEWAPEGWARVATAGTGARTRTQCLRVADRPIYAAQFHIEMDGTADTSRRIMANFLAEARRWGGYRATAHPLSLPSEQRDEKAGGRR